jgi:ligand-binding SRPBCC domain-containing protein
MKFRHCFEVDAPLAAVADFHAQSASLKAITPPPARVQLRRAPARLGEGDELQFTIWLGPLPVHWLACIEHVGPTGFTDRQLSGPFRHWVHRHSFVPVDRTATAVVDQIEFGLRPHPWWGLFGLGMWLSLPMLFAYRGWKTRRLVQAD